jgi:hypothetical protein
MGNNSTSDAGLIMRQFCLNEKDREMAIQALSEGTSRGWPHHLSASESKGKRLLRQEERRPNLDPMVRLATTSFDVMLRIEISRRNLGFRRLL